MTVVVMEAYVCPQPGCGNYFAMPRMPEFEKIWNLAGIHSRHQGQPTHNRAECPDCRNRGDKVQRVRTTVRVMVEPQRAAA